jgi:prolyl-tRNA editing enzyme YbaK/EbsC (Cys-tRNA(Pro) deacylase)
VDEAVRKVVATLREHGAEGEVRTFTESVPTAAAAAERLGCEVGAIANSLVFVVPAAGPGGEPEPVLVLTSGAHRVDTRRAAALLGAAKLKRATPEQVLAATGQQVGGCAPVGHPRPLRTIVDTWLGKYDVVWAGGGDEFTMVATSLDELARLTSGTVADIGA